MNEQPVLFIGHGAPTLALDSAKGAPLRALGETLSGVSAILVVSAHWEESPPTLGATEAVPLVYDFSGFPRPLYSVAYPAPGAPELAERVAVLLGGEVASRPERGLDHGVWTPLVHLFPEAETPVLQLSMPSAKGGSEVFRVGARLAPLRAEGVLLIGSGNVTHDLRALAPEGTPPAPEFLEFDRWVAERLAAGDFDALLDALVKGPAYRRNHPTPDHWFPLLFAAGAARSGEPVSFPVEGWEYGNLSRRAVKFG
jgi:4,5-DOPA dioxygenase extradiol